jgi:glycine cleavage system aminomethyltransferase T
MGYVKSAYSHLGTELQAMVRDKPLSVKICHLPFVEHNYKRL